jgi:hypothetical protein
MPTVLLVRGWRVFSYAYEGNEPVHVYAKNGDDIVSGFWRTCILAEP